MTIASQREQNLRTIIDTGLIAVIRIQSADQLQPLVNALVDGGIKAVEITMTTPNALETIRELSQTYQNQCLFGCGTVLDTTTARNAILAGARFIVSPVFDRDVVDLTRRYSAIAIPGTFTPTEILTAWEAGADIVKVFPAPRLGPGYFKDVLAPLPQVRLLPTGVSLENISDYFNAGVDCVSIGAALINPQYLAEENWSRITETGRQFIQKIEELKHENAQ